MIGVNDARIFLFDLDGTLADSLPELRYVYDLFAQHYNFTPSDREFQMLNGPALSEIIDYLKKTHSLIPDKQELLKDYNELLVNAYIERVKPNRNAKDLLKTLFKAKNRLFLVTSASSQIGLAFIKQQHWESFFEGCIFGDDVKQAKPCGEIYRLAITRYNLDPEKTLVVEDSANGVIAARDADLAVVGVGLNEAELFSSGAHVVYASLNSLLRELVHD